MIQENGSNSSQNGSSNKEVVTDGVITTGPIAGSEKVYVPGIQHEMRVPMRKISQAPTKGFGNDEPEENPPIYVYDCSGPYTDATAEIDIYKGLEKIRENWIEKRADVERLEGHSSAFTNRRARDPKVDEIRFPHIPQLQKSRTNNMHSVVDQQHQHQHQSAKDLADDNDDGTVFTDEENP